MSLEEKQNNISLDNTRIVDIKIVDNCVLGSLQSFNDGTITSIADNKYLAFNFINNDGTDSITSMKKNEENKENDINYSMKIVKCINIVIYNASENKYYKTNRILYNKNLTYVALGWINLVKIVSVSELNECFQSGKTFNVNMTDYIDLKNYNNSDFHSFNQSFSEDGNQYIIANAPYDNKKYINVYIYSCKNNQLIEKFENKLAFPSILGSDLQNFGNFKIHDDGCISFWYDLIYFKYNAKYELISTITYSNYCAIKSPTNKYVAKLENNSTIIKIGLCEENEKLIFINTWELDKSINSITILLWSNDNILIAYNNESVFVFKRAIVNKLKKGILFQIFNLNEIVNVILDLIGFEFYGCWLCPNPMRSMDEDESDIIHVSAYFGKQKEYVFIIACNYDTLLHVMTIIELDNKYAKHNMLIAQNNLS